jgi:tRNA G18 (ribose-2'-O)-methylase SpoU
MNKSGYFGIGIERGKTEFNYWTLFRTAQILDASFLFTIGAKFKPGAPDTMCSYKHMPVFSYSDFEDFNNHRPYNCKLIGVELHPESKSIVTYKHPKRAIYLLGSEDNGLSRNARDNCQELIILPGERSMNVSVAGSIVLYDRVAKNTASKKE